MKRRLRERCWWPGIDKYAIDKVARCEGFRLLASPTKPKPIMRKGLPKRTYCSRFSRTVAEYQTVVVQFQALPRNRGIEPNNDRGRRTCRCIWPCTTHYYYAKIPSEHSELFGPKPHTDYRDTEYKSEMGRYVRIFKNKPGNPISKLKTLCWWQTGIIQG